MKGNCAMDGRFAFNVEVNIAKVGNFAKDDNVTTKGQQIIYSPSWQHAEPGTMINNVWLWVLGPNGNQSP